MKRSVWFGFCFMFATAGTAQAGFREDLEVGLTLFQIGKDDRAVSYLARATAAQPRNPDAVIPYGISLARLERYADAVSALTSIPLKGPLGADGAYFLGRAYLALGIRDEAQKAFRKSAELIGPLSNRALLEAGRLALTGGDVETARRDFERLLQLQAAGELAAEAKAGLAEIERRRANRFAFNADAGLRYDSNVPLVSSPTANDAGVRAVFNLQARYRTIETKTWRSEFAALVNQGRFFDQVHRPFDLGVHRLNADLTHKFSFAPIRLGAEVALDYQTKDFGYYRRSAGVGPTLTLALGSRLATAASWQARADDFANPDRDGVDQRGQVNQFVFWDQTGYAGVGASYERAGARSNRWFYTQTSFRVFGGGDVYGGVLGDVGVDTTYTRYSRLPQPRTDTAVAFAGGLSRFWGLWGVRASAAYLRNAATAEFASPGAAFRKWLAGFDIRLRL